METANAQGYFIKPPEWKCESIWYVDIKVTEIEICDEKIYALSFCRWLISGLESVIIIGNGVSGPSSNPGRSYIHFTQP